MYFEFVKRRTKERSMRKLTERPLAIDAQPPKLSQRQCWEAVASRDSLYDRAFVYAVRSTGIYCRPSCPSRRPRRKQVVFFRAPKWAERDGFRPCRRCHPREMPWQSESRLIAAACRLIEQNSVDPIRMASVARRLSVGPFRLQRMFRKFLGITPSSYAHSIRLRHLKEQLRKGNDVTTALYEAGYSSPSRLYEGSDRQLGMTPALYRRGGKGMEISYTTAPSDLGRLLLAGTAKGVSAIYLGDSDARLEGALRREYPAAVIRKNPARVSRWLRELVRHISGRQPRLDLPLDVKATVFQRRVWEALQRIPRGSTQTYSDLARSLGLAKGQRAVARACATNPVSVLIPCHRVVRRDGGLGGYRWGIDRKRALLAIERNEANQSEADRTVRS
jgi:AraC family transcriptional regulator, regulatory protein of adaptative response / methylated-DNA-[protein]-cysteine methyltransferase